ncbi:mariner Mos1 transposase [Trichonephila clavipes]|nr:mariner Mos1 transposase [Trichonephila clavipes]
MGSPTPPAVFYRHCSLGLSLVSINAHGQADQHFRSYEEVKILIDPSIASKYNQFFQRGIRTLPERWEKVVASDGQYFES